MSIRGLKTHFPFGKYTIKAVDGIDLDIGKGRTLGLVGESGSGKSVTALSIMRLVAWPGKIVDGQILLHNEGDLLSKPMDKMREIRGRNISMIFQDPAASLNPVFNVGFQIAEAIYAHRKKEPGVMKRVEELLEKLGIESNRHTAYPHQFSGGMRQRIMIAMALACNPDLLIADEPTTNLDVTISLQILEAIRELREESGMSVLYITHDLGVVAEMAHDVAVMYAGKLMEKADVVTIFKHPRHPYTRALLSSIPSLEKDLDRLEVIPGEVPDHIVPVKGCLFHPRCKYQKEVCRKEEPTPIEISRGHFACCHLLDEVLENG